MPWPLLIWSRLVSLCYTGKGKTLHNYAFFITNLGRLVSKEFRFFSTHVE